MAQLRQYATTTEYSASPLTSDTTNDAALVAASLDVDALLTNTIYDVDDDGLPTDQDAIDALRDATIAQVQYSGQRGDPTNVGGQQFAVMQLGSARLVRSNQPPANMPGRYAPQAEQILRQAGLLGSGPQPDPDATEAFLDALA